MTRIVFLIGMVVLPFLLFALYRLTTLDKRTFREKWPFAMLTIAGLALSSGFYAYMFLSEPHEKRVCYAPPRFEGGEIVKGEIIPCPTVSLDERDKKAQRQSNED